MNIKQLLLMATMPAVVLAATIDITVGGSSPTFDPNQVVAVPGDLLNFHFASSPASVTQSNWDRPCGPIENGISSGQVMVSGPTAMVYQVNVTNTDTIWLYSAAERFCNSGMAMVVNQPTTGETIRFYQVRAENVPIIAPTSTHGGRFISASEAANTPASSTPSIIPSPAPTRTPSSAMSFRLRLNLLMSLVYGAMWVLGSRGLP